MPQKAIFIPVNFISDGSGAGVSIERLLLGSSHATDNAIPGVFEAANRSHREDGHSFFLLESGAITVEIDFQQYAIGSSSVIYMHPNQVHRIIAYQDVIVSSWAITNENLNPDYLNLLEEIVPAKPLVLEPETCAVFSEAVSLCLKFAERKGDRLFHSVLKDSCNALVALVISQYLQQTTVKSTLSRVEIIAQSFRKALELNYTSVKSPAAYARKLNVSTPYLNECVKEVTGYPVTHHIQQRIVLEAKRLLSHSDRSVKEIAAALGYDDYPYFSRLFTKAAGMSAGAFRNRHRE